MGKNRFSARQWHNCATCQFWCGPRDWDAHQNAVVTDGMECGECTSKDKPCRKYATNTCIAWTPWTQLTS